MFFNKPKSSSQHMFALLAFFGLLDAQRSIPYAASVIHSADQTTDLRYSPLRWDVQNAPQTRLLRYFDGYIQTEKDSMAERERFEPPVPREASRLEKGPVSMLRSSSLSISKGPVRERLAHFARVPQMELHRSLGARRRRLPGWPRRSYRILVAVSRPRQFRFRAAGDVKTLFDRSASTPPVVRFAPVGPA
jgi:hypothetical protein